MFGCDSFEWICNSVTNCYCISDSPPSYNACFVTFCANFAGSILVLTILSATTCPVGLLPLYRSARWHIAKPPFPSAGPVAY